MVKKIKNNAIKRLQPILFRMFKNKIVYFFFAPAKEDKQAMKRA